MPNRFGLRSARHLLPIALLLLVGLLAIERSSVGRPSTSSAPSQSPSESRRPSIWVKPSDRDLSRTRSNMVARLPNSMESTPTDGARFEKHTVGVVLDPSGNPLSDARVSVTEILPGGGLRIKDIVFTDSAGCFFADAPPDQGAYVLRAQHCAFTAVTKSVDPSLESYEAAHLLVME